MARPVLVPDPISDDPRSEETVRSRETVSSVPPTPLSAEPSDGPRSPGAAAPQRFLIAGLIVALALTGLALIDQSGKATRLAGEVAVLEAEVAEAAVTVEAYQVRFSQVRAEVGELVSRIASLSGLVTGEVVTGGTSAAQVEPALRPDGTN